jgi:hypothetical protein
MTSTQLNAAGFPVRSYCRACKQDFNGDGYFDQHRVGSHEYDWSPEREDGRRCLGRDELEEMGWALNTRGRWFDPAQAERIREVYRPSQP